MSLFIIDDDIAANDFKLYFKESNLNFNHTENLTAQASDGNTYNFSIEYKHILDELSYNKPINSDLIFGKDKTERIISLEVNGGNVIMVLDNGEVKTRPFFYWMLSNRQIDKDFVPLKGNLHYKFIKKFKSVGLYRQSAKIYKNRGVDFYTIWDQNEAAMVYYGITLFKGMKVSELSILSFDLETSGLVMDDTSKVFTIANTYRDSNGKIERRLFRVDDFDDDGDMISNWSIWVKKLNPAIIT